MSEAKHTKGPWQFVVEDGDRKIVAPTLDARLRTSETLMCDTSYYPWCPDAEADWHLIAGGPEMLDALEAALPLMVLAEHEAMKRNDLAFHDRLTMTRMAVAAAINKATGAA